MSSAIVINRTGRILLLLKYKFILYLLLKFTNLLLIINLLIKRFH